jgi:CHASE3 domain sensor protein
MAVEDLAATIGLDAAVSAIAVRDERTVEAVMDSWQQAVERIASDERCRFVDSLRPYVERIESELDGEDLVAAE